MSNYRIAHTNVLASILILRSTQESWFLVAPPDISGPSNLEASHKPRVWGRGRRSLGEGASDARRRALLDRWVSVTPFASHLLDLTETDHHLQFLGGRLH